MKVAIVGCGKIADGHVEQIQKVPHLARVVAACDREALMAEQLAARFGIASHYDDFGRLLERERPDVVHITTPPASHLALTKMAVEAGAHVYVEKPITLSHATTEALVDCVESAGKKLTVGYTYLFDPPALAMRSILSEGLLGDVVHVESHYGYNLAGPYGSAIMSDPNHWVHRMPGGIVQNNIDHLLNKLVEFFPHDDSPRMHAFGYRLRPASHGDARDAMQDELRLMLQGERVSASAMFSSHARPMGHCQRVYGTKDTLFADFSSRTVTLQAQAELPSAIGRLLPAFGHALGYAREGARNLVRFARSDFHFFAGLLTLVERFYESLDSGGPPPIPHRDIRWISARLDEVVDRLGTRDGQRVEKVAS